MSRPAAKHSHDEREMKLQIFTSQHCITCADAIAAASACAEELAHVHVEIIDVDREPGSRSGSRSRRTTFVLDGG